jgi:hypothetical protein
MKMKVRVALAVSLAIMSSTSFALESFVGNVVTLEPSYLPSVVAFQMNAGNATCPSGTWLFWGTADQQNNKGVYATLMTALIAGKQIRFHINNGDTTCKGQHIHLIN